MITRATLFGAVEARLEGCGTPLPMGFLDGCAPATRGFLRLVWSGARGCVKGWMSFAMMLAIDATFFHTPANELSQMTHVCLQYTYSTNECASSDVNVGPLVWNLGGNGTVSIFDSSITSLLENYATVR